VANAISELMRGGVKDGSQSKKAAGNEKDLFSNTLAPQKRGLRSGVGDHGNCTAG